MKRKKRIPFLFLCALSLSGIRFTGSASAESGGGLPLFSRPFAEGRWRHNFTGGGKTAEPAAFRLGAGTDGIRVTVYGKKRANRNAEFTSLRAGVTPFRQRRFTANFFYGSLRYNGLASRLRNPPGAGTATVYSPVRPTKSLFFGQGDASDKQTLAGEILAGNWRFAVCGEPEDSGPVWFSAGWSGKLPLYPAVSLSVTGFTGRQILPEKPSDSWFPHYHRDNAAEILHAGGEFAVQHKHFSASVFVSAAEGILRRQLLICTPAESIRAEILHPASSNMTFHRHPMQKRTPRVQTKNSSALGAKEHFILYNYSFIIILCHA